MSNDQTLNTSTSIVAIEAAASVPTGVISESFSEERRRAGQESEAGFEGAHKKKRRAIAMTVLQILHEPDHNWIRETQLHNIFVPTSGHIHMPAVAATFGASASNAEQQAARSKFLDRDSLAVEYLVNKVQENPSAYHADENGIAAIIALIDIGSGIGAISKLQRTENMKKKAAAKAKAAAVDGDEIPLDAGMVRLARIERSRQELSKSHKGVTFKKGLIGVTDSGEFIGAVIDTDDTEIDEMLLELNTVDPLVDRVGELLQASKMVAEFGTNVPKNIHDNPNQPANGYRDGFRHIIFRDGLPITTSPLFASSSVVLHSTPFEPLLDRPLKVTCHFRTEQLRILEQNIADAKRRAVFSARIEGPGKSKGICKIVVSTDETKDRAHKGKDIGVLVEPLHSPQGNLPLDFDHSRFKPTISGYMSLKNWRKRDEAFVSKQTKPTLKRNDFPLKLKFSATSWKTWAEKKEDDSDITAAGGVDTELRVMSGDLRRVSETIASLPIEGDILVAAESHTGICLTFASRHFKYVAYIPALTTDNVRTTNLVAPFTV